MYHFQIQLPVKIDPDTIFSLSCVYLRRCQTTLYQNKILKSHVYLLFTNNIFHARVTFVLHKFKCKFLLYLCCTKCIQLKHKGEIGVRYAQNKIYRPQHAKVILLNFLSSVEVSFILHLYHFEVLHMRNIHTKPSVLHVTE